MKLPNRFGTVTKLSGNRRKPWVAREGLSGHQKPIGYAATKEEALILLSRYNSNPWDIEAEKITFEQLYELWLEKRATKLGSSNYNSLKCAYKHCLRLNNVRYKQIKAYDMQDCIDSCSLSASTQNTIKNLFWHLERFAMELDIVATGYSALLKTDPTPESKKQTFTDEEVMRVWDRQHCPWVDSILFLLYTGFRISEMRDLRIADIDLVERTMKGGTKTDAGKNRIVPIHSKIFHIVKQRYEASESGFLFEHNGQKIKTMRYRQLWLSLMDDLHMTHTPHECRHTFRSRLDSAGANKVCIDLIMGHKSQGTGERVYTHKTIDELKSNIELITN